MCPEDKYNFIMCSSDPKNNNRVIVWYVNCGYPNLMLAGYNVHAAWHGAINFALSLMQSSGTCRDAFTSNA